MSKTRLPSVREQYERAEKGNREGIEDLRRRFGNIPLTEDERRREAQRERWIRRNWGKS